MKSNYLSANT